MVSILIVENSVYRMFILYNMYRVKNDLELLKTSPRIKTTKQKIMPRCLSSFSDKFSRFGLHSSPIDEPAILLVKRMSSSYEEHRIDGILALTSNKRR